GQTPYPSARDMMGRGLPKRAAASRRLEDPMPDELPFLIPQIRAVLREAFEGGQGSWTYFIDNRPNTGMLGTIDALTAAQASQPSGAGDSTVAAHLHHVCFSLEEAAAFIRGDHSPRDWSESWKVKTVDDAAWAALRA